jgi:hypothetical protein
MHEVIKRDENVGYFVGTIGYIQIYCALELY